VNLLRGKSLVVENELNVRILNITMDFGVFLANSLKNASDYAV